MTNTSDSVRFISSSLKIPPFPSSRTSSSSCFLSSHLHRLKSTALRILSSRLFLPAFSSASLTSSSPARKDPDPNPGKRYGKDGEEERVLISEVLIRNKDGEELERSDLAAEAAAALKSCRPNSALTVREVQEDVSRIIDSGYFCACMPVAVDTRDGIRLVFQVEPNQEFRGLICEGANVLPAKFVEDSFRDGYAKIVNLRRLDEVVNSIDGWYSERGLFGMVSDAEILSGGIIRLAISEAEVNNITMRFLDRRTGEPTTGKTKPETILRQLTTKKGQVYSLLQGKRDVETILTMGIMEDVSIIPQPAGDTGKVDLVMNLVERVSRGFSAGGGISSGITSGPLSGLIGSFAYSHRNVFGRHGLKFQRNSVEFLSNIDIQSKSKFDRNDQNDRNMGVLVQKITETTEISVEIPPKFHRNSVLVDTEMVTETDISDLVGRNQKLNLSLERGQLDSIYRINYSDPWIEGDDKRTSRSFTLQNSRTPGTLVHGSNQGQGNVTVERVTAGIEYSRPLRPKWSGTAGVTFQRAGASDDRGNPIIRDFYSSPLTASGNEHDDSFIAKAECVYTGSGDHGSSVVVVNAEQGIPVIPDWLSFSRVTARMRKGFDFGPTRCFLSLSGGHVVGRFSPHEAFAIGGTNSVRGYEEGAVGSGRSYVVGSGEVSFPLFGPMEGVTFADYGSDIGSGASVPGDPAGARGKPGSGYGYGAGIRVNSPLGPLRLEYAVNDRKAVRFHFGVGQRN